MKIALACTGTIGLKSLQQALNLPKKIKIVAVFTQIIEPPQERAHQEIIDLANQHGIESYTHEGLPHVVKTSDIDYIIAIKWRKMIGADVISNIKELIVFHASLLPKYRGFAPINWPIINGEKETGVTMFFAVDEVDSGDIIDQRKIVITENDDANTIDHQVSELVSLMLYENLLELSKGMVNRQKQNSSEATYCIWRTPEDGLINWNNSAIKINNLVRGLTYPYPGAYTFWEGKKISIWKTKLITELEYVGNIAGKVAKIVKGEGVYVLTGDGVLCIEEVSIENKERVRAEDAITKLKIRFLDE